MTEKKQYTVRQVGFIQIQTNCLEEAERVCRRCREYAYVVDEFADVEEGYESLVYCNNAGVSG